MSMRRASVEPAGAVRLASASDVPSENTRLTVGTGGFAKFPALLIISRSHSWNVVEPGSVVRVLTDAVSPNAVALKHAPVEPPVMREAQLTFAVALKFVYLTVAEEIGRAHV